jgi:outer membrane protein W
MTRRIAFAAAAVMLVVAAARDAGAVENQHHVGLGPQLAILKVDDKSTLSIGGGLALHYTYGLNDQLNVMAELGGAIVAAHQKQDAPDSPHTRPAEIDHLAAGIGYVIDVIRYVPYIGILASGYRVSGGTIDKALVIPGVELAVGLDYQLSRSWAVGLAARQHMLLTKLSTYPTYTTGLLRVEYMWGF